MKIISLLLVLLFSASCVQAQSTAEIKADAQKRYERSDKALNAAYQKLMASLGEEGKTRLKVSQRAWLTYRDSQARFDCHHFHGGSFEGLEYIGSLDQLTQARTKQLLADFKRFKEM